MALNVFHWRHTNQQFLLITTLIFLTHSFTKQTKLTKEQRKLQPT